MNKLQALDAITANFIYSFSRKRTIRKRTNPCDLVLHEIVYKDTGDRHDWSVVAYDPTDENQRHGNRIDILKSVLPLSPDEVDVITKQIELAMLALISGKFGKEYTREEIDNKFNTLCKGG